MARARWELAVGVGEAGILMGAGTALGVGGAMPPLRAARIEPQVALREE